MNRTEALLRASANSESSQFQRMLEFENQQSALQLEVAEQRACEGTYAMEVRQANEMAQLRQQQFQAQEQRAQVQLRSAEQRMIADSSGALQN